MKKKIAILGVAAAMMAVVLGACNDQLDQEVNGVSSVETFYATDADADLAIISIYDLLTADNLFDWASPTLIKTLPSDEGTAGGGNSNDQPRYQELDNFTWNSSNAGVQAVWTLDYMAIYRANMIIANIEATNELRERVIAEAKAMRAYFYLDLVMMFGDVPLVLTELTPDEFNQARTPKAEVYEQIELDLNDAIAVLPTKDEYAAGDKFRASKGMAYALLGKALLYQEDYPDAVDAFNGVTGYGLQDNYADIFKDEFEFGTESILEGSFEQSVGYSWDFPWNTRFENNLHVQLMGARAGDTPELDLIAGWGFNYPSAKLYNAYEAGDTRLGATCFSESDYLAFKSTDPDFDGSTWWDYNGYFRLKYGSFSEETNQDGAQVELNYGTNWRLIRYADILLLRAEAKLNSGDAAGALTDINAVRTRAGVATLGSVTMQDIMDERFRELAFEGHRYFDLIRWGEAVANTELGQQVAPTFAGGDPAHYGDNFNYAKHQLFPIPATEIAAATLIKQNPLY